VARTLRNLTGPAAFLVLWLAAVRSNLVQARSVPPPGRVLATVLALMIAVCVAFGMAVPAGPALGSVARLRTATRVIVEFLRPVPSVALIPLVILLVGGGPEEKITLAVYAAAWPILYIRIYALGEIDPLLLETARSRGAGRIRVLVFVALPHAAPFVFTGVRMAGAIALIVVVSTEFLAGASRGIGNFILTAGSGAGRMDLVLAATLVAGSIGYLLNEGLERFGRRPFRWIPAALRAAAVRLPQDVDVDRAARRNRLRPQLVGVRRRTPGAAPATRLRRRAGADLGRLMTWAACWSQRPPPHLRHGRPGRSRPRDLSFTVGRDSWCASSALRVPAVDPAAPPRGPDRPTGGKIRLHGGPVSGVPAISP
jgi:NitT/TauT family transport system permease protein